MPDTIAEHTLGDDLPVRVVEHPLRSGPSRRHRHLAPATRNWPPGIGCTVICDSARSAIGVTAARSGVCTVMRAATGRAAAGSGKHAPAAETVVEVTAARPSGLAHTATISSYGPIDAQTRTSPSRPPRTP